MTRCPCQGLASGKPLTSLLMGQNRPLGLWRRQSAAGEGRREVRGLAHEALVGEEPLTQGLEPRGAVHRQE